jgi:hypothetical protein
VRAAHVVLVTISVVSEGLKLVVSSQHLAAKIDKDLVDVG